MSTKYYINKDLYIGDTGKQLKDTTIAGDSLPINAIVEYSGQSVPEGYELVTGKQYDEYVLYDDYSGTNGNVTLSSSSANYDYLEIYYRSNDGDKFVSYQKAHDPNQKRIGLVYWHLGSGTQSWIKVKEIYINGATIENVGYTEVNMSTNTVVLTSANNIYITRVIGLKEA